MKQLVKIKVRNEFSRQTTLWLEPWGEDYGMLPEEELEVIAKNVEDDFHFDIDFGDDIKVWAGGQVIDIGVYQNGLLLECGYRRIDK